MSGPGVYAILGALLTEGASPEEAAEAVARRKDLRSLVLPLLAEEARRINRSRTRTIEHRVERELSADPTSRLAARQRLVAERFALPDGRFVLWLDATAEDHRARAGWLRAQANDVLKTAKRHERAADEIEAAGVACLRDLERGVAA